MYAYSRGIPTHSIANVMVLHNDGSASYLAVLLFFPHVVAFCAYQRVRTPSLQSVPDRTSSTSHVLCSASLLPPPKLFKESRGHVS